jgi:hypothetical protein
MLLCSTNQCVHCSLWKELTVAPGRAGGVASSEQPERKWAVGQAEGLAEEQAHGGNRRRSAAYEGGPGQVGEDANLVLAPVREFLMVSDEAARNVCMVCVMVHSGAEARNILLT